MKFLTKLFSKKRDSTDLSFLILNDERDFKTVKDKKTGKERTYKLDIVKIAELFTNKNMPGLMSIAPLQDAKYLPPLTKTIGNKIVSEADLTSYFIEHDSKKLIDGDNDISAFRSKKDLSEMLRKKDILGNRLMYFSFDVENEDILGAYKRGLLKFNPKIGDFEGINTRNPLINFPQYTFKIQTVYSSDVELKRNTNGMNVIDYIVCMDDGHVYRLELDKSKLVPGKETFRIRGLTSPLRGHLQYINLDMEDYEIIDEIETDTSFDDFDVLNTLEEESLAYKVNENKTSNKDTIRLHELLELYSMESGNHNSVLTDQQYTIKHLPLANCIIPMDSRGKLMSAKESEEEKINIKDNVSYIRNFNSIIRDLDNNEAIGGDLHFLIFQHKKHKSHDFYPDDLKQYGKSLWVPDAKSYKTSSKIRKIYKRLY